MAESKKNIVILGGSYGGVSVAHYLLKHAVPNLPERDSYQVIIVSTSSQAMCRPACPRALISDDMFPQEKLFVSIPKQFEQYPKANFRFVHGTATKLDDTDRTMTITPSIGDIEKLNFHALVIATGASTPSPLLSLNGDVADLRRSWSEFRAALPTARTIVIAGGGPAGIETAGELGEHLNGRAGWFRSKLTNPKVSITVVTSSSKILPLLRPSLATKAESLLSKVGVTILKNTRVESVSPSTAGTSSSSLTTKSTLILSNGQTLTADLYIPATGLYPNTSFMPPNLLTADGRVATDPTTLRIETSSPRIYAIGDVSSYARPAIHNILSAVPVLGETIKADLLDTTTNNSKSMDKKLKLFKEDTRETQLVPIGKATGVGALMGYRAPGWVVWAIKGRDYWLWTTGGLWSGKQWNK